VGGDTETEATSCSTGFFRLHDDEGRGGLQKTNDRSGSETEKFFGHTMMNGSMLFSHTIMTGRSRKMNGRPGSETETVGAWCETCVASRSPMPVLVEPDGCKGL
jgi:hypothetical protein